MNFEILLKKKHYVIFSKKKKKAEKNDRKSFDNYFIFQQKLTARNFYNFVVCCLQIKKSDD